MSFKISIRDVQAVIKADIDAVPGLNVIVGDTNAGKSAVMRAIKGAVFNSGSDDLVRIGKRYGAVKLDNGKHTMMWRRDSNGKNNKTMYQFDGGDPIGKVGRTQLQEVVDYFNLTDVKMNNNNKERLNFWEQGDPPFLVNRTSGQLFEFLSLSSCDRYIAVLKDMKADVRDLQSKTLTLSTSIDTLRMINDEKKAILDANVGFDDVYKKAVLLSSEIKKVEKVGELVSRIEALNARKRIKQSSLDIVIEKLSKIDFEKAKTDYESFIVSYNEAENLARILGDVQRKNNIYKNAKTKLVTVTSVYELKKSRFDDIKKKYDGVESGSATLSNIKSVFDMYGVKKGRYNTLKNSLDTITLKIKNIDMDSFEDEIRRLEDTNTMFKSLTESMGSVAKKKKLYDEKNGAYNTANDAYEGAVKAFGDFKNEIGFCPYCDSNLRDE
jgi:DNA repair protein SbcC/Rad50